MMSGTATNVHLGGMSITEALEQVERAQTPEDLFGPVTPVVGPVKRIYRKLAFVLHPDQAGDGDDKDRMSAAFAKLSVSWEAWNLAATTDATTATAPKIKAPKKHPFGLRFAFNAYATLYRNGDTVTKVARDTSYNERLRAERDTLTRIADFIALPGNDWLAPFFNLPTGEMNVSGHEITTFARLDGFVTLDDVAKAYPSGIEGRDWSWMMRRLLAILAAADAVNRVHANIAGANVLINPVDHRVILVNWTDSDTGTITSDVTALAALGTSMLNIEPDSLAQRKWLAAVVRYPSSPAALIQEYDELLRDLYGAPKFHPFTMPSSTN